MSPSIRTCVGCGKQVNCTDLFRVVAKSSGVLSIDFRGGRPGRGAWIHKNLSCVELARSRRAFARSLRITNIMDDDLWSDLEEAVNMSEVRPTYLSQDYESGLEADGDPMSTQR